MQKNEFFEKNFNPVHLIILEVFIIIPFFWIHNILIKILLVFLFYIFATINNKRISLFYNLNLLFFIILFNLLSPSGEVLLKINILNFNITKTSLMLGLKRGFSIIGLVFISLFCVQKNLSLPSKFGNLVSKMFYYHGIISQNKYGKIKVKSMIEDIDNYIMSIFSFDKIEVKNQINKTNKQGILFIILTITFIYTLFFLDFYIKKFSINNKLLSFLNYFS